MQVSTSKLNPGEGHEFRSLCLSCLHYEFSIGFFHKNEEEPYAEHLCHTGCLKCIPGDCVIYCDHYEYVPGRLVDRFS